MTQQTLVNRVLVGRTLRYVLALLVFVFSFIAFQIKNAQQTEAATSSYINFQARLKQASGAIVPDGYYNVQFKLYDASASGANLWTETYYDSNGVTAGSDNRVRVVNGYLTVSLGSQTAFPALNWDQEMWITMNIGGTAQTASPSWDGEMNPRLRLTAVPYAFQAASANQLQAKQGSYTGTLGFTTLTANRSILLPNEGGTVCIQGSTNCGFAASSGSGNYIQNGTSPQTADFNITGSGTIGTDLTVNGNTTLGNAGTDSTTVYGSLNLTNGNSSSNSSRNQITLGYNNTMNYRHAINSRHNANASEGNAIDFYVWQPGDTVGSVGSLLAASIEAGQFKLPVQGAAGGLLIGADTNLYRSAADTLKTDDSLIVSGDIDANNVKNYYLTRTVPTTVDDYVEIGKFTITASAQNIDMAVSVSNSNFSLSKRYILSTQYCNSGAPCNSGQWYTALPITAGDVYNGNDFDIDIQQTNGTSELIIRLRRASGSTAGTARVSIEQRGDNTTTFAAMTGTGSTTAPASYSSFTVLTQREGSVGLGVQPAAGGALLQFKEGTTFATGIQWGNDTQLYRSGANTLSLGVTTALTASGSLSIRAASGANTLTLDTGNSSGTVTIGATAGTVNVGASSTTNVTVGSSAGTSTTTIQAGSGNINLNAFSVFSSGARVSGGLHVNTATNTAPFTVGRGNSTVEEYISVGVEDAATRFTYTNDENGGSIIFRIINTDTEAGGGANANDNTILTLLGNNNTSYAQIGTASTGHLRLQNDNGTNTSGILFGSSQDTNLYRSAANTLQTDDSFVLNGAGANLTVGGTLSVTGASSLTGNVTIGTVTAAAKLTVNGSGGLLAPIWSSLAINSPASSAHTGGVVQNVAATGSSNAIGLQVDSISSNGLNLSSVGLVASRITANGYAAGVLVDTVSTNSSASTQPAAGMYITNVTTNNNGNSYGLRIAGVSNGSANTGNIVSGITIENSITNAANTSNVYALRSLSTAQSLFAGAVTVQGTGSFTGVGTGLSVTNNATIGGTLSVTGAATLSGTLAVTGDTTLTGDLAVNGGDITSTSATVNLFNGATPSTINLATSANATAVTIGNTTGASGVTLRAGTGNINLQASTIVGNATTQNLFNTVATTLNIGGAVGAGGINLAGGSGSTGCTIDGSNGNLTCSGTITGGSTGTVGYWSRSGTTLQPATSGDNITTSGNISTSGSGTITAAGILHANATGKTAITIADSGAQNSGITIGGDTNLYRSAANRLQTDDALVVGGTSSSSSTSMFQVQNTSGASILNVDTTNGRVGIGAGASSNDTLDVDGSIFVRGTLRLDDSTRQYTSDYSATIASGTPIKVGEYTFAGNSRNAIITGEIRGQEGASKGVSRFVIGLRSNTLPSKNISFTQDTLDNGKQIRAKVYEDTTTGRVVLAFTASGALHNVGWTITVQERGNYDGFQNTTTYEVLDTTGLSEKSLSSNYTQSWFGNAIFQNATDSTAAFQVQKSDGTTLLGVDTTNNRIFSTIPNSSTAIGFTLNTPSYTTNGARLMVVQNNGVDRFSIDKNGHVKFTTGTPTITTGGGTGACSLAAGSNDVRGQVIMTTVAYSHGVCTVNFANPFSSVPFTVVSATTGRANANATATLENYSVSTTQLTITGPYNAGAQTVYFNYWNPE